MAPKEHPLLRTLVVYGASLVGLGCGGRGEHTDAGAGGDGGGAAIVRCPEQCSSPAQFVCDDLAERTNCRCNSEAPRNAEDCESIWDFTCQPAAATQECATLIALGPSLACACAPERLQPEDCAATAQFTCTVYQPVAQGCRCEASAPTRPEDCPMGLQYSCHDRDPDIGCQCAEIVLIK